MNLISPQWLIESVHRETDGHAIVATDVGQHQMWAAQFYQFNSPHKWVTSGFQMTMQEMAVIKQQKAYPKMTFVVEIPDENKIEQLTKQLNKQIDVLKVNDITETAW